MHLWCRISCLICFTGSIGRSYRACRWSRCRVNTHPPMQWGWEKTVLSNVKDRSKWSEEKKNETRRNILLLLSLVTLCFGGRKKKTKPNPRRVHEYINVMMSVREIRYIKNIVLRLLPLLVFYLFFLNFKCTKCVLTHKRCSTAHPIFRSRMWWQ